MSDMTPELLDEIAQHLRESSGIRLGMERGLTVEQIASSQGIPLDSARGYVRGVEELLSGKLPTTPSAALNWARIYRYLHGCNLSRNGLCHLVSASARGDQPGGQRGEAVSPRHAARRGDTADRGYGEASVERDLHELGVRHVAIPRKSKPSAARREFEHRRSLPRESQMADRVRRTDQPHQTKLRLEPHRTHRHPRGPNMVRARRFRPQSRQDRHPRSMRPDTRAADQHRPTPQPRAPRRSRVFQVEVAREIEHFGFLLTV